MSRGELSLSDRLELLALPSRYVHIVDDRRWDRLGEVFTEDVVCDYGDFVPRLGLLVGLEAVRSGFAAVEQPLSHHTTDAILDPQPIAGRDGCGIRSKILVIGHDRRSYVGVYLDTAVRTPGGWRIAERTARRARDLGRA